MKLKDVQTIKIMVREIHDVFDSMIDLTFWIRAISVPSVTRSFNDWKRVRILAKPSATTWTYSPLKWALPNKKFNLFLKLATYVRMKALYAVQASSMETRMITS